MRSFLSYDIDDANLLSRVASFQQELSASGCDLKLVRPEILHFTIRFFGEIDQAAADRIVSALTGHVENFEINASFNGVGVFPNDRRISVIWIGMDEASASKLSEQAKKIYEHLDLISGIPREDSERFSPHVTIARVRSARNKTSLLQILESHKKTDFGSTRIKNLKLKQSELLPSGPKYSDVHVFG